MSEFCLDLGVYRWRERGVFVLAANDSLKIAMGGPDTMSNTVKSKIVKKAFGNVNFIYFE